MLGFVVAAVIAKGAYGPVEIGFFHRIAEHALAGNTPTSVARAKPAKTRPKLSLVFNSDA